MATSKATPPTTRTGDWSFNQHTVTGATGPVNILVGGALGTVSDSPYEKLRQAHGIIMILAWGFFAVVGTFIARYLKSQLGFWL
jgi:hypothetical protein